MKWKILKEQYREVLNNQLTTDPVDETIEVYQQLLENGYDEQQAIDKMTPYLHRQVIDALKNDKVNAEKWNQLIEPLKQDIINDLEYLDKRQLERLL